MIDSEVDRRKGDSFLVPRGECGRDSPQCVNSCRYRLRVIRSRLVPVNTVPLPVAIYPSIQIYSGERKEFFPARCEVIKK
jgi:hypothetical protein